ncbi:MAG: hypothetical protein U0X75_19170 [Acidobacteriota bacterium]
MARRLFDLGGGWTVPSAKACATPKAKRKRRRLFYVALTRAQDELYVCFRLIRKRPRAKRYCIVRRDSLPKSPKALLEIWSVDEEDPLLALDGLDDLDDLDTPKLIN